MTSDLEELLAGQADYYRKRAGEYDDWWFRRGRYDHGPDANALWFADAGKVQDALERFGPTGEVLELACGTGLWTERLVAGADRVTAVDNSPEMLAELGWAVEAYATPTFFVYGEGGLARS